MATSDYEQRTELVPQHKRIAMGEKLDGTAMQPKGGSKEPVAKHKGGLSHGTPKKNK
jgi:hypothetical protein